MVAFTTAFVAASVAAGVLASPVATFDKRANTPNAQGTSGGYWYQFWDDGTSGTTTYTNGAGGEYSVNWNNVGDFTSGKGWSTAQPRNITFQGTVQASGNFYLAVYTWSGQGENYILEDYGSYNPCSSGTNIGTIYSDGSNYQYCLVNRGNNYLQNWSVRQNKRSSGTVTTANHYNYYAAHGNHNPLSAASYQIVSTEGFSSSGSATITVGETGATGSTGTGSGSSPSPSPSTTTSSAPAPTTSSSGGSGSGACSALYGQCGGQGWSGATCCSSGTCKYSNAWYSQCL